MDQASIKDKPKQPLLKRLKKRKKEKKGLAFLAS
jgi:hypothetical protein